MEGIDDGIAPSEVPPTPTPTLPPSSPGECIIDSGTSNGPAERRAPPEPPGPPDEDEESESEALEGVKAAMPVDGAHKNNQKSKGRAAKGKMRDRARSLKQE